MSKKIEWDYPLEGGFNPNNGAPSGHDRRMRVSDDQWDETVRRAEIVRRLVEVLPGQRANAVRRASLALKLSTSTIYRMVQRFEGRPSDIAPSKPGCPIGYSKLLAEVRAIIAEKLDREYLTKQRVSLASVVRSARAECAARGLPEPSYSSIERALEKLDKLLVAKRRGDETLVESLSLTPGGYEVVAPMSVWQIDHTLLDAIIVSELDRVPIGRPWVTLIMDVASRMVAGYYLSLDPPSSLSVARALTMAVMRKDALLERHGLEGRWPVFGPPLGLHSDNASEFAKAAAYRRGCEDNFIAIILRPIGKPRYGGHIERLIGSMMGRVKFLPGATFSNPKQRGTYNSVAAAKMSIYDVERWLLEQILDYHNTRHRTLGATPLATWDRLCAEQQIYPCEPARREEFYRDFLPVASAKVLRKALQFNTIEYSSPLLAELKRRAYRKLATHGQNTKIEFRYDPADMSQIFVEDLQGQRQAVPLNHPGQPVVTLWEVRAELARRRALRAGPSTSALTIAGILAQRAALANAGERGRRALRALERLRFHGIEIDPIAPATTDGSSWSRILGEDQ